MTAVRQRKTLCLLGAFVVLMIAFMSAPSASATDDGPTYGPELEGFSYPWPVQHYEFVSQGVPLHMAFMDVKPATPNGRTWSCTSTGCLSVSSS